MPPFRPSIEPQVLKWARETMFLAPEEAARKIGVQENVLLNWEAGAASPTLTQLRKVAAVYRHSLATFLLATPPPESRTVVAFRTLPSTEAALPSPAFADGLRRATRQQAVARHLADLTGDEISPIDFGQRFSENAEKSGHAVREWLGISLSQQLSWKTIEEAFRSWTRAIENRDILVIHVARVELSEMRAFAEQSQPFPVIGLNGKDAAAGKTFSLLHELAHILLASEDNPSIHVFRSDARSVSRDALAETFCNQVAAAALMPAYDLLEQTSIPVGGEPKTWSDEQIRSLSARYKVSREALLLRLVSLGKADQEFYRLKKQGYDEEYRQRAEAQERESGGGDYYRLKVRDLGRRFVADVLSAYGNEDISSRDVTRYLGVRLGQLPRLENLVQRH